MSEILKRCPFCGGEAKRISENRIACKMCGVRTVSNQSYLYNKALWNKRAAEVAEAKAANTQAWMDEAVEWLEVYSKTLHNSVREWDQKNAFRLDVLLDNAKEQI